MLTVSSHHETSRGRSRRPRNRPFASSRGPVSCSGAFLRMSGKRPAEVKSQGKARPHGNPSVKGAAPCPCASRLRHHALATPRRGILAPLPSPSHGDSSALASPCLRTYDGCSIAPAEPLWGKGLPPKDRGVTPQGPGKGKATPRVSRRGLGTVDHGGKEAKAYETDGSSEPRDFLCNRCRRRIKCLWAFYLLRGACIDLDRWEEMVIGARLQKV